MGLIVNVYRNARSSYDCTNGGISSKFTMLCLMNVEGPFEPSDDAPPALLSRGYLPGSVHIVPADQKGCALYSRPMFGGNFAATSDSRFSDAISALTGTRFHGAVAIHDRVE